MKNRSDIVTGDSLERKQKKAEQMTEQEKEKNEFTIYSNCIGYGLFFCAGVWTFQLNIDHTQPNTFWNRTSYHARQELF